MTSTKIILSLIASACIATTVSAMEFQVLGARATSMGGAGIATSPSSLAAYNNPALLGHNSEKFSIHIGAGIGIKDTGAGKAVGDLNDLKFSEVMDHVQGDAQTYYQTTDGALQKDINTLKSARDIIKGIDQKGFQLNPTVDVGISFGSFGTGLFGTSDLGAIANIDQTHTALIFAGNDGKYYDLDTIAIYNNDTQYKASSLQYAVENKTTNLNVVGIAIAEVPLAYGYAFDTGYGSLSVGGALKLMAGKTFFTQLNIDSKDTTNKLDQNVQNSTTFGVDLGLAYKPSFDNSLTVALVGKNLNTPTFDVSALAKAQGGTNYELKPAVRAGAAYKFGNWVELAFDADLTENKSVTGYKTQYIGGGANLDLSVLELNIGLMQNMAANDISGLIYTAGVATGPKWLHLELAAQMASEKGAIDGTSYPRQAMVNIALSSAW